MQANREATRILINQIYYCIFKRIMKGFRFSGDEMKEFAAYNFSYQIKKTFQWENI